MASPQKENGYTAIANEILEHIIKYQFPKNTSSTPLRLCLFVIRKTYGFHKKMDIISLSQFQEATNEKSRTNLVYWLNYLVQAKVLVRVKKSNMQIEYGFNKDYDQWLPLVQAKLLVQARSYTSTSHSTETSTSHSTHKRKKENTKENSKPNGLRNEEFQELIDSFQAVNPSYRDFYSNVTERKALQKMSDEWGYQKLLNTIRALEEVIGHAYAPKITKPTELRRDIGKLVAFIKQQNNKKKIVIV